MATVTNLNIPLGLEDLFYLIFRPQGPTILDSLTTQAAIKRKDAYSALALRSLFVLWQDLYDSFDSARRHRWDLYWLTLPFGSHSGANGWPGSGYSAFVYHNAPRYRNGLPLDLDPPVGPVGPELIFNGNFDSNLNGWQIYNNWFYFNHRANFGPASPGGSLLDTSGPYRFSVEEFATYRFTANLKILSGVLNVQFINGEKVKILYTHNFQAGSWQIDTLITIQEGEWLDHWEVMFHASPVANGWIDSVSVRRIS